MNDYSLRRALVRDLDVLSAIERAAARRFPPEDLPPGLRDKVVPRPALALAQREGRLWVAADAAGPVGFALVETADGLALLAELNVHPDHGRRGLGKALVRRCIAWAKRQGLPAIALTTFAQFPWNAPFYERLGFRPLLERDEIPAGLLAALEAQGALGMRGRIAMRLDFPLARRQLRLAPLKARAGDPGRRG